MARHSTVTNGKLSLAASAVAPLRKRLSDVFRAWQRRGRSRRELATLSEGELKDLGYFAAVDAEKSKPFWKS